MTQPADGPFTVFSSDAYLRDDHDGPQWRAFYEHEALTERLVAEDDIEAYDWDNQALTLTEGASRRFKDGLERTKECPRCFTCSGGTLGPGAGAAQIGPPYAPRELPRHGSSPACQPTQYPVLVPASGVVLRRHRRS